MITSQWVIINSRCEMAYFLYLLVLSGLISVHHVSGSYTNFKKWVQRAESNSTMEHYFQKYLPMFDGESELKAEFPCDVMPPSNKTPTSVHKLRPADVQIVAAMGDSITAGTGITAKTIIGLLIEDRGLSWSIGGDGAYEDQPTIPNMLKKYNPNIKGFAVKTGGVDSKNAHLNVAVPGAKSEDMVEQAHVLVKRLKMEPGLDFEKDWKLITIFIGGNDLCDFCDDTEFYSAKNYVARVKASLDILHAELPRAFVNLVAANHVDEINLLNDGLICTIAHELTCACGAFPRNKEATQRLHQAATDYNKGLEELVVSEFYDTREDFTVVLQPFFKDTKLPRRDGRPDLRFFAPDCFHFSKRGHSAAAIALWNNMLHPTDEKRTKWMPGQTPDCPNEDNPYFFTSKNSVDMKRSIGLKDVLTAAVNFIESMFKRKGSKLQLVKMLSTWLKKAQMKVNW